MDSISSYYFVGRPDRVAELHDLIRGTRFADGAGGLPGNNDSGATSSWYVLSSLGLVPQSGSPYWFVTIPAVAAAEVDVRGGMLYISVDSHVRTAPGRAKAYFNGRELADWRITTKELMSGGNLVFKAEGSCR
jgi:putative alpha-1,2-mannosidase